jgi:hypothetical protein
MAHTFYSLLVGLCLLAFSCPSQTGTQSVEQTTIKPVEDIEYDFNLALDWVDTWEPDEDVHYSFASISYDTDYSGNAYFGGGVPKIINETMFDSEGNYLSPYNFLFKRNLSAGKGNELIWSGGIIKDLSYSSFDGGRINLIEDLGYTYVTDPDTGEFLEFQELDSLVSLNLQGQVMWQRENYLGDIIKVDEEGNINVLSTNGNLSKLTANGAIIWTYGFNVESRGMAIDNDGNIYITGYFERKFDFDLGHGLNELTPRIYENAFLSKYDTDGNLIWVKQWGLTSRVGKNMAAKQNHKLLGYVPLGPSGFNLTVDESGNIYLVGVFSQSVDFDPGPGVYEISTESPDIGGVVDFFLMKFNTGGEVIWVQHWNGDDSDQLRIMRISLNICLDNSNGILVAGPYYCDADFDPGSRVDSRQIGQGIWEYWVEEGRPADIFISRFDRDGHYHGVATLSGAGNDTVRGLSVDQTGAICIAGTFEQDLDFDPGPAEHILTSPDVLSYYLAKYIIQ